ncbi:AAEL014041-PA [Aedes aegypti]|uniref:AAEL014041-PA n=1 Tax=Aedes aegypti TaxID=7159 RepID=Q16HF7_AEDAE|nr:AAEL014041-PA [Aedes aegypti]
MKSDINSVGCNYLAFAKTPKTRPSNVLPTRYASLPCSSPPKQTGPSEPSGGSLDDGRNKLGGIGISAVHDAVLRGMTRLPEPIVNEHPVTIYPGRASPPRRASRNLQSSIERHRDLYRKGAYNSDNSSSQENSSPENNEFENNSSLSTSHGVQLNINYNNNLISNRIFAASAEYTRQRTAHDDSDEERFSDDSLEESSLPPPPGPPTVPPPPSLSAPVTPSKRHSIAWEVNLDDPASFEDPLAIPKGNSSACSKCCRLSCNNRGCADVVEDNHRFPHSSSMCSLRNLCYSNPREPQKQSWFIGPNGFGKISAVIKSVGQYS